MAYGVPEDMPLEEEDIQLPLTRPVMFYGIPYALAICLGTAFFAIDNEFRSFTYGFIVLPIWAGAAVLVKRDFNGVRVFTTRLRLFPVLLDAWRWGGLSASPFPAKRPKRFRGMRHAA